ncbi:MAG: DUF2288 domain-containing protein [Gallionella sp.]
MSENNLEEIYRTKVNLETAQIAWKELQRFFANGMAIFVSDELDLVDVAFQMSKDNTEYIQEWMDAGKVGKVEDEQATTWIEGDAMVWAVVVKPYVLVQAVHQLQ